MAFGLSAANHNRMRTSNAYNHAARYDWLGYSTKEVQGFTIRWLWTRKHEQLIMALGCFIPKQKLALAAWPLYFVAVEKGDYPQSTKMGHSSGYTERNNTTKDVGMGG